ncbi:MAG: hypothetical protein LC112_14010 [Flavobacteriales bacterium]|nr:hypothetical protein [Flavobacteriales bacterium]
MIKNDDKYFTDIDVQLQQVALTDWATFAKIIGDDAIIDAKIHLLKARGNSMQQIANRLDITKGRVRHSIETRAVKQHKTSNVSTN